MVRVVCPYCGKAAEFIDSKVIYGRSYGMIYLCKDCRAWVGCHKGTDKPLGRLANAELREWKQNAHHLFDKLWKGATMRRGEAYAWLAGQMGKTQQETHIGMFDVEECKKVVHLVIKQSEAARHGTTG